MYLTISHWQNLNMIHIASITPELHQLRYKSSLVASQGPHSAPALLMPLTLCQVKSPAFFLQDTESEERQFMLEAESSKLSLSLYLNQ